MLSSGTNQNVTWSTLEPVIFLAVMTDNLKSFRVGMKMYVARCSVSLHPTKQRTLYFPCHFELDVVSLDVSFYSLSCGLRVRTTQMLFITLASLACWSNVVVKPLRRNKDFAKQ